MDPSFTHLGWHHAFSFFILDHVNPLVARGGSARLLVQQSIMSAG
jgi:hypothetical protein